MLNNDPLPPVYTPDAATALLTLASAVSNPKKLQEMLDHLDALYQRIQDGRQALDDDRAALVKEKNDFHAKSGSEWQELQQRISRELADHKRKIAEAERAIASRDEQNKRKWAKLLADVGQ